MYFSDIITGKNRLPGLLRTPLLLLGLIGLCQLATGCQSQDDDTEIPESEVPPAIIEAFTSTYPGATLDQYSEELEDGETYYEITFSHEGRKMEAVYDAEGILVELEAPAAVDDLPQNIHIDLSSRFTRFHIQKADKIVKGSDAFFEIEILNLDTKTEHELIYDASGQFIEEEE